MSLNEIFKAYDVRGKVGSELNAEVAETIGRSFADWLPKTGPVAVGRDMRPDSKELADALIKGILTQGRDVWDIGEITSDMIYFAVGANQLAGGAVVTASHNPGEYNGIKFCKDEAQGIAEDTGLIDIRDRASNNQFKPSTKAGQVIYKDVTEAWIKHVLSFVDDSKLKPFKIVVDAGNGMAGKIFAELEPYVPFEVSEMYFELDGTFPNHIANPLEEKNLVDIKRKIKDVSADLGIAFDGDGDRAVLIDENGMALSGTIMSAMLAEYILKQKPGSTIILNAICGQAAVDVINKHGGKLVRSRVGHSFIKNEMRKSQAEFAGEHSGHYYFKKNFMADSGMIAALLGLYVLSLSHKKLSELVKPYRDAYVATNEINFEVKDKNKILQKTEKAFDPGSISHLDGLTVSTASGWFNVRPSNTEPLLRLNAEAKTKADLDQIIKKARSLIEA
jgi:phosphomannomutase